MKTAAVFFADGFEEIEALTPVDYLRRADVKVVTVGVKGTLNGNSMIVTGAHKVPVIVDMTMDEFLKEIGGNLPDCIVCPGGMPGAKYLSENKELLAFIEKCFDGGKLTAAICASPALVFGKTKVLAGKKWTCYPGMEDEADVKYIGGYSNQVFVTDGNVVTSRGPGASEQFSMELVKILEGEDTAAAIKAASQQRV